MTCEAVSAINYLDALKILTNLSTPKNQIATDISEVIQVWKDKKIVFFETAIKNSDDLIHCDDKSIPNVFEKKISHIHHVSIVFSVTLGVDVSWDIMGFVEKQIQSLVFNKNIYLLKGHFVDETMHGKELKIDVIGLSEN